MEFYLLLVLFISLLGILIKNRKIILIISGIILILIISFRDITVGNDTENYYRLFVQVSKLKFNEIGLINGRFEMGYIYLNKILSLFWKNPMIIFIVSGIVYICIFFKSIKFYSKDFVLSILLIILMGYFGRMMNIMRELYALSFTMIASQSLIKKRNKSFIFLIIIAYFFHKISIVFISVYFIYKQKINKKNILILIILTIITYILFDDILKILVKLLNFYTTYSNSKYRDGNIRVFSLLGFFINFFICVCQYKRLDEKKLLNIKADLNIGENERKEIFLFWMIFISTLILFISFKFNLLDRVANYFGVYIIFIIPNLINDKKRYRIFLKFFCIIYFLGYFMAVNLLRPYWNTIIPYKIIKKN